MRVQHLRVVVIALFAALAVACGESGPKPAKLTTLTSKTKATVAWRTKVGDSGPFIFSPSVRSGDVFAAGENGTLTRLDARNGRRKWRVDTKNRLAGGVNTAEDMVVVGSAKGVVLAYSLEGKPKWTARVSSEVLSPVSVANGIVVVRSADGRIHGLDAKDGAKKWEYIATLPPLLIRTAVGLAIDGNVAYAGLPGGKLVALDIATGAVQWEAIVAQSKGETELERVSDVVTVPIIDEGQVCAIAFQGRVACFDTARGTLIWARNASSVTTLGVDENYFYYVDEAANLHAVDRDSGAVVWKQDVLANRGLGAPTVVGRYVVAGDFEGYLHFFSREDGSLVTRISLDGGPITAAPVAVSDTGCLVQTRKGSVYAISIR